MASPSTNPLPISLLRLRVATNLFKDLLLGNLHLAGNPQAFAVFDALTNAGCEQIIADRTWKNWFSTSPVVPQVKKAKALDSLAAAAIQVPGNHKKAAGPLPSGTFSALIHGGLVRTLTAPSEAKKLLPVLVARALEYEPVSPLHLHIDAIEVCATSEGVQDIHWTVVKAIGAKRILELIAARWSRRHGTIYCELSSNMALKWQDASEKERREIMDSCARFKPNLFEYFMDKAPSPDWNKVNVGTDIPGIHICKALFAIGADSNFLVADRLSAWSLDLATAALAMHALAWTDRYETFGVGVTEEMMYWQAFDSLLFKEDKPNFDQFDLLPAMTLSSAEWDNDSERTLLQGRQTYHQTLIKLGTSSSEVLATAMQGPAAKPLVYKPNADSGHS